MGMKTGKTSHVDHYKSNSILIRKAQKEHITTKAIRLRKLRIVQVSFQTKIDASSRTTTAKSGSREIQNNN